jgi:hypothetical protein
MSAWLFTMQRIICPVSSSPSRPWILYSPISATRLPTVPIPVPVFRRSPVVHVYAIPKGYRLRRARAWLSESNGGFEKLESRTSKCPSGGGGLGGRPDLSRDTLKWTFGGSGLGGRPDFSRDKALALSLGDPARFILNQSVSSLSSSARLCASRAFALAFSRPRLPTLLLAEKPYPSSNRSPFSHSLRGRSTLGTAYDDDANGPLRLLKEPNAECSLGWS